MVVSLFTLEKKLKFLISSIGFGPRINIFFSVQYIWNSVTRVSKFQFVFLGIRVEGKKVKIGRKISKKLSKENIRLGRASQGIFTISFVFINYYVSFFF